MELSSSLRYKFLPSPYPHRKIMERSKIVAIITGAISILLAVTYLIVVQILDYRDMKPAPLSQLHQLEVVITLDISQRLKMVDG